MLRQRVITALMLLACFLPALFWRDPRPFCGLMLLLIAAGAWEWSRLNGYLQNEALAAALVGGTDGLFGPALATGLAHLHHAAFWCEGILLREHELLAKEIEEVIKGDTLLREDLRELLRDGLRERR